MLADRTFNPNGPRQPAIKYWKVLTLKNFTVGKDIL